MKKNLLFLFAASLSILGISAQNQNSVLMKINNHPITKSEFEYLYNKNKTAAQQSLDEYLNLFINYKLKVEEAISLKYDTVSSFKKEFESYKNQITQPYLVDTISELSVAKKIYDRLGENIEVSHILIRFPQGNLLPKDTLSTYEKALAIRAKLSGKKPMSFEAAAKEYSEDPSAKQSERAGYLGWATAMAFVSPFEDAMYATKVNEVSMPIRTIFGYHLIKVHNKKADAGKVKVAHIMFGFPKRNSTAAEKDSVRQIAENVYNKLSKGESYAELCKLYSTDKVSAANGGTLGWVRTGMGLPAEFLDAAFALKDTGDITKPMTTDYGYHIIKLEGRAPRDSWSEAKPQILGQIKRSDLVDKINKDEIENLRKDLKYTLNKETYDYLQALANSSFPTDSAFLAEMKAHNKQLFTVNSKDYDLNEFGKYLASGSTQSNISTDLIDKAVNNAALAELKNAYASTLADKYPDYGNLLKEYYDGILLFNVMNDLVWEKAANDTVGLTNYFDKNKTKYKWDSQHYKGYIVYCKDEATYKAAQKQVKKCKKGVNLNDFLKKSFNNDSVTVVVAKKGIWGKGDNKFVDAFVFNVAEKPEPIKDYPYYFVTGKLLSAPEEYLDVKGLVISDLQEQTEKEWLIKLREKYPVEIDQAVFKTIK